MIITDIIHELKTAKTLPKQALRAGVAQAQALTPTILNLAEKVACGLYPLPQDGQLLFYGLHILAAARETRLCPLLLQLVCVPWQDHQRLFGEYDTDEVAHLVLTVYDGDEDALLAALENAETDPCVRWTLIETLARLTCDGQIARAHTLAFLERFEQEPLAAEDDPCWAGWADAVVHLGLVELEPALRRVWQKPGFPAMPESARQEALEQMAAAAADPSNPQWFIDDGMTPVTDPVEELQWLEEGEQAEAQDGIEEERAAAGADDDPAAAIRLTPDERDWLAGFLLSHQTPDETMDLEMLDGFFTALVIGPDSVAPSEYMPIVWGADDAKGPIYDSAEQAKFVTALLMRHWNTIAARFGADYLPAPLLTLFFDEAGVLEPDAATTWAVGFLHGVAMRETSWKQRLASMNDDIAERFGSILMLAEDDAVLAERNITPAARADMVANLPHNVLLLHRFFRQLEKTPALLRQWPSRSTKVGRNQPCPCGSGKKYKHCCGSGRTPSVH